MTLKPFLLTLFVLAGTIAGAQNTLIVAPGDNFVIGELPPDLDSIVVHGYCRLELLAEHRMRIGRIVVAAGGRLEIGTQAAPIRHVLRMHFTAQNQPAIEVAPGGALSLVGWSGNLQLSSSNAAPGTFLRVAPGADFCRLSGVRFSGFRGTPSAPVVDWVATPGFIHGCTFAGAGDQLHVDAANELTISRNEFKVTDGRALRLGASGLGEGNLIRENTFYVTFSARPQVRGELREQGRVAVLIQNPLQGFVGNFISTVNAEVALAYTPPPAYDDYTWRTDKVAFACRGNTIKNVGHPAGTGTGFWFGAANLAGNWTADNNVVSGFELGASVRPDKLTLRNWRLFGNSYGLAVGDAPLEDVRIVAGQYLPRAATGITFGRTGAGVRPRARNLHLSGYPVGIRVAGEPAPGNYLVGVEVMGAEQPLLMNAKAGAPLEFPAGADWLDEIIADKVQDAPPAVILTNHVTNERPGDHRSHGGHHEHAAMHQSSGRMDHGSLYLSPAPAAAPNTAAQYGHHDYAGPTSKSVLLLPAGHLDVGPDCQPLATGENRNPTWYACPEAAIGRLRLSTISAVAPSGERPTDVSVRTVYDPAASTLTISYRPTAQTPPARLTLTDVFGTPYHTFLSGKLEDGWMTHVYAYAGDAPPPNGWYFLEIGGEVFKGVVAWE